eukprot:14460-Hanusia_phi.AAC.7
MMNLQLMCHYIAYKNRTDHSDVINNYLIELQDKAIQMQRLYVHLENVTDENERESTLQLMHKINQRIELLQTLVHRFNERMRNKSDIKINLWNGNKFSDHISVLYYNLSEKMKGMKANMSKQFINDTSDGLAFSMHDDLFKLMNDNILKMLGQYTGMYYKIVTAHWSYLASFFNGKSTKVDFFDKYGKMIEDSSVQAMTQRSDDFIVSVNKLLDHLYKVFDAENVVSLLTSDFSPEELDSDLAKWLSAEDMEKVNESNKHTANLIKMLWFCLKEFKNIKIDKVSQNKKQLLMVKIQNLRKNTDLGNFMDDLFYFMRYKTNNGSLGVSEIYDNDELNVEPKDGESSRILYDDVEGLINSMHVLENNIEDKGYIIIGFENRKDVILFFRIMYLADKFGNYADGNESHAYWLRKIKEMDEKGDDIFYTAGDMKLQNSIEIDLVHDEKVATEKDFKIHAIRSEVERLSYQAFKCIERFMKSFRIYTSYFYKIKTLDYPDKTSFFNMKMQKGLYIADFLCAVLRSGIFTMSMDHTQNRMFIVEEITEKINEIISKSKEDINGKYTAGLDETLINPYETLVDACYLGLSYKTPALFVQYPVDFDNIDKSNTSEIIKQTFSKINTNQNFISKIKKGNVTMMDETRIANGDMVDNITRFATSVDYYKHCLDSL